LVRLQPGGRCLHATTALQGPSAQRAVQARSWPGASADTIADWAAAYDRLRTVVNRNGGRSGTRLYA